MAVLFLDGMDHYNLTQAPSKWNLGVGMAYSSTGGRFGGGSLNYDASNFEKHAEATIATSGTLIIGMAIKIDTLMPAALTSLFRIMDGSTTQTEIRFGPSGQFAIFTAGSQVGAASANGLLTLNVWHHLEWKITIASSTGPNECLLRLDNVEILNLTGVSTKTSSNTTADTISIGRLVSTQCGMWYDDVYVFDNTGDMNNDLIGDCRIETLYPNGAGNYAQLSANGAGTNYGCVNEHPADDDTTYVAGNSVGNIDSYAFGNPVGTINTVYAVQANMRARKDNAGVRTVARLLRVSGTDYVGSDNSLSTSYALYRDIMEKNPATDAAWTSSDITALEAGVKVTS
jgi:hypothetical protein